MGFGRDVRAGRVGLGRRIAVAEGDVAGRRGGGSDLGHGGGAHAQHTYCASISWDEALPGDLVFYPEDSHVGIVGGRDESGNLLIVHCASGANNVVITGADGFTSIGRPHYYGD